MFFGYILGIISIFCGLGCLFMLLISGNMNFLYSSIVLFLYGILFVSTYNYTKRLSERIDELEKKIKKEYKNTKQIPGIRELSDEEWEEKIKRETKK